MKLKEVLKIKAQLLQEQDKKAKLKNVKDCLKATIAFSDRTLYLVKISSSRTENSATVRAYVVSTAIVFNRASAVMNNVTLLLSELLQKPLVKDALQIIKHDQRLLLAESFINEVNTVLTGLGVQFTSVCWL